MSSQSTCELCGGDHANEEHSASMERTARAGKQEFIVEVVDTTTYRAWATDSAKAEDAVYWRRSSGRPTPDVEDLSASTRTIRVR